MRRIALLLSIVAALPAAAQQIDYTCLNRCVGAGYSYLYCEDKCSYGTSPTYVVPTPPAQRRGVDPTIAVGSPDAGAAALEAIQRGRENRRQEEQLRIQREQLELQRQQMETYRQPTQQQPTGDWIEALNKAAREQEVRNRQPMSSKSWGEVARQIQNENAQDAAGTNSVDTLYDRLTKLDELRKKGLLTDAEFEQQKQKILNAN